MPLDELGTDDVIVSAEPAPAAQVTPGQTTKSTRKIRLPISGNNLVLAAMFVGGIVAVYILKLSVKPETATAQERKAEQQVEAAIAQMGASGAKTTAQASAESVVDTLHNDARDRQIPAWVVAKNPFVFEAPKKKSATHVEAMPAGGGNGGNDADEARAEVRRLKVQTVLIAAEPIAMISGRSIRKGQTIRGWTVVAIESTRVVLTWQSKDKKRELKHVLIMEERQQN